MNRLSTINSRNTLLLCLSFFAAIHFISCEKKDVLISNQSFVEEFTNLDTAIKKGWRFLNRSIPANNNSTQWQQGSIEGDITAYSPRGSSFGFITANFEATSSPLGTISNWAVSPPVIMQNGDRIVFFTRSMVYSERDFFRDFINRLQLRINRHNDSADVGTGTSVGSFDQLLLDINPTYEEYFSNSIRSNNIAYPVQWTRFEARLSGLSQPVKGRFAFRYFLEEGGAEGRGSEVGLDSVAYIGQ